MMARAPLTHDAVLRIVGDLEDIKVAEIIASGASEAEVLEAYCWATRQNDVMGEARKPLTGKVAQIYEILTADEVDEDGA